MRTINLAMHRAARGPRDKVQAVIQYALDHDIQIISFGLAPNPNGFCFEASDNTSETALAVFDDMLNQLSAHHEERLRKIVFGPFKTASEYLYWNT